MNIKVEHFTEQVHVLIPVIIKKVFQIIFHSFLIINLLTVLSCTSKNTKNEKNVHCFNILIQSKKHVTCTLANTKIRFIFKGAKVYKYLCSFHRHIRGNH